MSIANIYYVVVNVCSCVFSFEFFVFAVLVIEPNVFNLFNIHIITTYIQPLCWLKFISAMFMLETTAIIYSLYTMSPTYQAHTKALLTSINIGVVS